MRDYAGTNLNSLYRDAVGQTSSWAYSVCACAVICPKAASYVEEFTEAERNNNWPPRDDAYVLTHMFLSLQTRTHSFRSGQSAAWPRGEEEGFKHTPTPGWEVRIFPNSRDPLSLSERNNTKLHNFPSPRASLSPPSAAAPATTSTSLSASLPPSLPER